MDEMISKNVSLAFLLTLDKCTQNVNANLSHVDIWELALMNSLSLYGKTRQGTVHNLCLHVCNTFSCLGELLFKKNCVIALCQNCGVFSNSSVWCCELV